MVSIEHSIRNAGRLLDFGCGDGTLLSNICELGCAEVVGVDINRDYIEKANSIGIKNATFHCGDIESEKFDIGVFDVILSSDTFVLFPKLKKKAILLKLASLLSPAGVFFLNDFNREIILQNIAINLQRKSEHYKWHVTKMLEYLYEFDPNKEDCFGDVYYFADENFYKSIQVEGLSITYERGMGLFPFKKASTDYGEDLTWIYKSFKSRDLITVTRV